jgi:hypothetical protein
MHNFQDYSILLNTLHAWLYVGIGILLACEMQLHDRIISLWGGVWAQ